MYKRITTITFCVTLLLVALLQNEQHQVEASPITIMKRNQNNNNILTDHTISPSSELEKRHRILGLLGKASTKTSSRGRGGGGRGRGGDGGEERGGDGGREHGREGRESGGDGGREHGREG
ncbi:hypothetical protein BJ944DRAFT_33915, partial [Cunninghamella echinulata]